MPAVGCAWNTTPSLDPKPACPHQPLDPLAADLDTSGTQLARRTLAGVEAMAMLAKGQVRAVPVNDMPAQRAFVHQLFGLAA